MVKCGWFPGGSGVAGGAGCAKSAGMGIILEVTGNTIHRSALEFSRSRMALGTQYAHMRPIQFEGRVIVIESRWFPSGGCMAFLASRTLSAGVHIFRLVAANAGHRRIAKLGCGQVAFCA